ncbi:MAG TPA: hypothetical protein VHU19_09680 [Pyrinomonadaceae bacterium]|nr:hypothetical protein [Pyrinomonadaceae bacterium]
MPFQVFNDLRRRVGQITEQFSRGSFRLLFEKGFGGVMRGRAQPDLAKNVTDKQVDFNQ